ncbi:MAG: esterase/lipase family protein [Brevundimonas aurantiaca]|uniref:esterase/lipase family protein n=1 Tax=Brevundimonas aurantiaca TaxID=74316 RepID=UPI00391CB295
MPDPAAAFGLEPVQAGSPLHSVVILHGIRQTQADMKGFANKIAADLRGPAVFTYGYDHTRSLEHNGRLLFQHLERALPRGRIDLVGYSMGGLVARLGASERPRSNIHTVVTLATPNRGSLSNAELTTLGQLGRKALEVISPILPRSEGVKDLTKARGIMRKRRKRLLEADDTFQFEPGERRYVSIPALWYSDDKADFEPGPSMAMAGVVAAFKVAALKFRLEEMEKSHDGIVTEASNNLTTQRGNDWAEFHLATPGSAGEPELCHAVIDVCDQHDHMSIVREDAVTRLICALLETPDWRDLKRRHPRLIHARLHPFAV